MATPAEERGALEQLRRLQRVTDVALRHLSVDALLDELLVRVREILSADTAAVLILDRDTKELVARAAKGLEEEVHRGIRIPLGRGFAGRVAAERRPIVIARVDHRNVLNPILREKGVRSLLGVPLLAQDEVLGVLHVGSLVEREFSADDVELLQLVADRVALALHVRLYERERMVTDTLQRTFLPPTLPDVPGLSLHSRYLPAASTAGIGGDWYDAFVLPGGAIALAIGDVAGHGLGAASVMGRIRNGLRAYALEGQGPARVVERLDRMVEFFDPGSLATLAFGVIDPGLRTFRYASAGHVPPLVLDDGGPRYLTPESEGDGAPDPPLGAGFGLAYREWEVGLPPGSTLLLYTDGLIERRHESLAVGLERLRALVRDRATAAAPDLGGLLSSLIEGLLDAERPQDDVAVLVARVVPPGDAGLHVAVPAQANQLARIRQALRRWLARTPVSEDVADDIVTASGEAAANAVEHAYGPGGGEIQLDASMEGAVVVITVQDHGRWRRPRPVGRGRGLVLMRAFMDSVEVERSDDGTLVRMTKAAVPG